MTPVLLEPVSSSSLYYSEGGWKMIQEGWNYAENVSANKRPNICSNPIYVRTYIIIHITPITPYITGYKMQRRQYCCFSLEGAGESVSYSTSAEHDGERRE